MRYDMVGTAADRAVVEQIVTKKLRNSILWMIWGLFTTMGTVIALLFKPEWLQVAVDHYLAICIIQFIVVAIFSVRQYTASMTTLKAMFFAYSILLGLTLSSIIIAYGADVTAYAFLSTLCFFIAFAIVGKMTSRNLMSAYPYIFGALIGLILFTVVAMLLNFASWASLLVGYVGIFIFSALTAVDMNRIKNQLVQLAYENEEVLDRIALIGALSLYLDFINLFISFLRIFGRK